MRDTLERPEVQSSKSAGLWTYGPHGAFPRRARFPRPLFTPASVEGLLKDPMTPAHPSKHFLLLEDISVSFKAVSVVDGLSLTIDRGEICALVGPNGAGKTTVLKTIAGLLQPSRGHVLFDGSTLDGLPVWKIVARGVVYIPEGMRVFREMSVLENLELGAYLNRQAISERLEMILELLPELKEKRQVRAGILSGGQQRMVTLGRGLMSGARLLLLDDPFQGLSPKVFHRFSRTFRSLKENGMTLFIAGQHVQEILSLAERAFLLEGGRLTLSGTGTHLLHHPHLRKTLFGTAGISGSVFHLPGN